MPKGLDEVSQRQAARVAGFMYLLCLTSGLIAEFCVRSYVLVFGDLARTASNIVASERLYRVGVACDLITFAGTVVLVVALYELLCPVNRSLALLATFWRLVECAILSGTALASFVVVLLLNGDEQYRQAFATDQLQALVSLSIAGHRAGFRFGGIFFGLGSALSSYLLFKSKYVPRLLAAWGLFASLLVLFFMFGFILFPPFLAAGRLWTSNALVIVFQATMGLWLLIKGIRLPEAAKVGAIDS
jgi:hypothetical protein